MGIVRNAFLGIRDTNGLQEFDGPCAPFDLADWPVRTDGFDQLVADAIERVERGKRILEYVSDVAAAHVAQAAIGSADQVFAVIVRGAASDDTRGRGDKPHDRKGRHGLARAALAYDTQALALFDMQVHAADRTRNAVLDVELCLKRPDLQEAHSGRRRRYCRAIHAGRCHRARQGA